MEALFKLFVVLVGGIMGLAFFAGPIAAALGGGFIGWTIGIIGGWIIGETLVALIALAAFLGLLIIAAIVSAFTK